MKFKKIVSLLLTTILAGALFGGCGQNEEVNQQKHENTSQKLGIISKMNASEQQLSDYMGKYGSMYGIKSTQNNQVVFYDNLNFMIMGLKSKSIDKMSTYKCVGNYIIERNSDVEILSENLNLIDEFCFAVRKEDTELLDNINNALKSMKDDDTLNKLIKEYIYDFKYNNVQKVDIAKIDGADTIKVGITGDLPPLDLVLADGTPSGFNTAVLSEVSKRINKNIELVQIDSGARAAALTSKQIDVIFWATTPKGDALKTFPEGIDKPDSVEFSSPYYEDDIIHVALKK